MKKYFFAFKVSWSQLLEYRFNFFIGRLRNIIVLLLLFYVWKSLSYESGSFAGYSGSELITYVFGVNILRSVIFGSQSRNVSRQINNGEFSKFLTMPINYFWYNFFVELAGRFIALISAIGEFIIFALILKVNLFIQTDFNIIYYSILITLLALFLYYILSYLISLLAFWSREAMGPRFLFEWFLEFASGAYFPLDILIRPIFLLLGYLPFFYLIFFPLNVYLGRLPETQILINVFWLTFWLGIISGFTYFVWQRGLKKYSGEGI